MTCSKFLVVCTEKKSLEIVVQRLRKQKPFHYLCLVFHKNMIVSKLINIPIVRVIKLH